MEFSTEAVYLRAIKDPDAMKELVSNIYGVFVSVDDSISKQTLRRYVAYIAKMLVWCYSWNYLDVGENHALMWLRHLKLNVDTCL